MPDTEASRLARLEAHWDHVSSGIEELKKGQIALQELFMKIQPNVVTASDHIATLEASHKACVEDCHKRLGVLENWKAGVEGKFAVIGAAIVAVVSFTTSILTSIIKESIGK